MSATPGGGAVHGRRPHGVAWVSFGLGGALAVLVLVMAGVLAPVGVVDRSGDPAPIAVGEPGPGAPGDSGADGGSSGGDSGSGSGTGSGPGGADGGPPPDVGGPGVLPPTLPDPGLPVVPGPLPVDPDRLGPWLERAGLPDRIVALGLACADGDAGACVTFTAWLGDECAVGDRRACLVLERAISGPRVAGDGAADPPREPAADPLVRPVDPSTSGSPRGAATTRSPAAPAGR